MEVHLTEDDLRDLNVMVRDFRHAEAVALITFINARAKAKAEAPDKASTE